MICIECSKPYTEWDRSYMDDVGMPKYYTETKTREYTERFPLCGPYCSLLYSEKLKGKTNAN